MIASHTGSAHVLLGLVTLVALLAKPGADPVQTVERIVIRGNTRTRDKAIRRAIGVAEVQPFTASDRSNMRRRLAATGWFVYVEVSVRPGAARDFVVLDISVIEIPKPTAVGFSSVENFIAEARITHR